MKVPIRWQPLYDREAVAQAAYQRILTAADQAIQIRGRFLIALAGGRTPARTYSLLKHSQSDWVNWHIYYGDERCLPTDDVERNSIMASRAWLDHVTIPTEQIHVIPAQLGTTLAARHYAEIIKEILPFDMVLLGMGEDGHTASLFPNQVDSPELVHAVTNAPKPPPERVSLSVAALSHTRALLVLITGTDKRKAVAAWRRGENVPIAKLQPQVGIDVLIDLEAFVDH